MSEAIILALIALVGSLGGSFFGVLASNNKKKLIWFLAKNK